MDTVQDKSNDPIPTGAATAALTMSSEVIYYPYIYSNKRIHSNIFSHPRKKKQKSKTRKKIPTLEIRTRITTRINKEKR
jgi:hypothetical protein